MLWLFIDGKVSHITGVRFWHFD